MELRWITVFVDQPADSLARGSEFWATVTGSRISPPRGGRDEFATLLPVAGDPFCRVQATNDDCTGVHLDFHVDSIPDAVAAAASLGATVVQDLGHVVMSSPAGLTFCFVGHHGEARVPPAAGEPPSTLDQVSIDVPGDAFDDEVEFWSRLFGWERLAQSMPEFQRLAEPDGLPVRLLFQRLGSSSEATGASAHLDISAGDDREEVADEHESLGATRLATFEHWIVMRDPLGLEYCVTARDPRATQA